MTREQRILKQWRDKHAAAREAFRHARALDDGPSARAALRIMRASREAIRLLSEVRMRAPVAPAKEPTPIEAYCAKGD